METLTNTSTRNQGKTTHDKEQGYQKVVLYHHRLYDYIQTWDLSKKLHDRISGPKILHNKNA